MPPGDKEEFVTLEMPVLRLKNQSNTRYLVYKNACEYVEVEANTAQDALHSSGVERPYKVVHIVKNLKGVIDQATLQKIENEASA